MNAVQAQRNVVISIWIVKRKIKFWVQSSKQQENSNLLQKHSMLHFVRNSYKRSFTREKGKQLVTSYAHKTYAFLFTTPYRKLHLKNFGLLMLSFKNLIAMFLITTSRSILHIFSHNFDICTTVTSYFWSQFQNFNYN